MLEHKHLCSCDAHRWLALPNIFTLPQLKATASHYSFLARARGAQRPYHQSFFMPRSSCLSRVVPEQQDEEQGVAAVDNFNHVTLFLPYLDVSSRMRSRASPHWTTSSVTPGTPSARITTAGTSPLRLCTVRVLDIPHPYWAPLSSTCCYRAGDPETGLCLLLLCNRWVLITIPAPAHPSYSFNQ
eukprot:760145-Pelagomonas_calceolata.AAC.1